MRQMALRLLTATRLGPPAQGWPLRPTLGSIWIAIQPQSGCVISSTNQKGRNRVAVGRYPNRVNL